MFVFVIIIIITITKNTVAMESIRNTSKRASIVVERFARVRTGWPFFLSQSEKYRLENNG